MARGNNPRVYKNGNRTVFGKTRSQRRATERLGIVHQGGYGIEKRHYRSNILHKVDQYLNGTQYDGLQDWDDTICQDDSSYTRLKDRKPKIIYPFAKVFKDRMGSKLIGASTFPAFKLEEDEDTEYFLNKVLVPTSYFKPQMLSLGKDLCLRTSAFMRFKFMDGNLQLLKYNSNFCYPEFDNSGELEKIEIKYVYETEEVDEQTGQMVKRWFKEELSTTTDTLYDNPRYQDNEEPEFQVKESVSHGLGYVQGEWFRIGESMHTPDGDEDPMIHMMCEFIDCLNYNLSLSDQATNYGTEPQVALSGMDSSDADNLIKSSSKMWMLGREGQAQFIETSGTGVTVAKDQREDYLKHFQHMARIVLLDPEKMAANAQSGKAMEVMHAPMVEFINEVRPWIEKGMKKLLEKIVVTIAILNQSGVETQFTTPQGWFPEDLNFIVTWPPIFELTIQDMQQILSLATQASTNNIISRETALEWVQSQGVNFGVEDLQAEVQKINTQMQFNTFSGF